MGGRLAKLINFIRKPKGVSDVRCDPGGGANVDAYHMQPAGDDAHPLPTDTAALVELPRSRNFAAVGYHDPNNAQTAGPGERRVYARDADGNQVAEVFLHNDGQVRTSNDKGFIDLAADGTIQADSGGATAELTPGGQAELRNSAGFIRLLPDGSVNINGFVISSTGQATDSGGIGVHSHSHTQDPDSAGNTQKRTDQASQP